jgi:hypothetical protein
MLRLLLPTWKSFSSWHLQVWRQQAAQSAHRLCQLCAEASTSSPTSISPYALLAAWMPS